MNGITVTAHGAPVSFLDLLRELEETAAWLDERADVLVALLSDPSGWRAGVACTEKRQALRDEAARFRGRAAVIRQTIFKAKENLS